jgi:hypothetical protein
MGRRVGVAIGIVLILLGGMLTAQRLGWLGEWTPSVWAVVTAALGLIFLVAAIGSREAWWALIPGCLFLAVGGLIFVSEAHLLPDDVVAGGFLFFGIGLPFWLILAVRGRSFWWAAIPAGVLTLIGGSIALSPVVGDEWGATLLLLGMALAFWIVYLTGRRRWWAIIPAGVLTTIGILPVAAEWAGTVVAGILFGGIGLTFLLIYLLAAPRQGMTWALWPAAICIGIGLLVTVLGTWANLAWPVLLIIGGLVVLVLAFRRR